MKPVTVWLLRHFPYSSLVKNQSLFLRFSVGIFITTLIYALFQTEDVHKELLAAFSFSFLLIFISSYLPRKETKVSSLVTQTGALELLDLSPLPIFTYEKRGDDIYIRFANKACQHTFSGDSKSLIGKPINRLVMLEDEDEMLSVCLETLESNVQGQNRTFFIRGQNQAGSVTKLMCATSQIRWLKQDIGICFLFDISESENQYASMREHMHEGYMSTLVAGIVHDFRNVLTSIIGTAEALQFDIKEQKVIKQLDVIIDAGERGSSTITELLQLSSSTHTATSEDAKDITQDLKSILSLLRLQLPKNVKLSYTIDTELPKINISTTQLEQILMNIINNATQAMDKNNGTIAIHLTSTATESNTSLRLTVSDNGCGIAKGNLSRVTDNFWTLRKDAGGTGLGLAMVKRIVTNLGGALDISSELNIGTQVCITLPTKNDSPATLHNINAAKPNKSNDTNPASFSPLLKAKPCTILLVDDQPSVLNVQKMLLEAMGHTVITALNGESAITAFEKTKDSIQMLITDFKMPDMDGIDLAEKLRESRSDLPLLMVTAYGEKDKLKRAKELNMTIILKPTNLAKFSKAVAETQLKHPNIFS